MSDQPVFVEVTESGTSPFAQSVVAGTHTLHADEPPALGGKDLGPNPYELLLAALGSCTSMTIRMYANLKKLPLTKVHVRLSHRKMYAQDCADCETKDGKIDEIRREIRLEGDLDDAQREKLLEIAGRCPVARTLQSEIKVRSSLVVDEWDPEPWDAD